MHARELYLEEFEPPQIFITIDGSWHSRYCLAFNSRELSLTSFYSYRVWTVVDSRFCLARAVRTGSLSPADRNIGKNVSWYLLKINVSFFKLLYMHENFAIRIAAERSPSLLTMTNKFETNKLTNKFVFEILKANTSRFAPWRIWLKMCQEMKEQAQTHYFRTILAIPNRISKIPTL